MKKIYQKYKDWFVIALLAILCFKSCQSCSRGRIIEFNDKKHTILIDSLERDISILDEQLSDMHKDAQIHLMKIQSLEEALEMYKEENKDLRDNNKHYRTTNKVLVNTNNQIINKEN